MQENSSATIATAAKEADRRRGARRGGARPLSLSNFRMGNFASELSLGSFRFWALRLGAFASGPFAWELSLRSPSLRSSSYTYGYGYGSGYMADAHIRKSRSEAVSAALSSINGIPRSYAVGEALRSLGTDAHLHTLKL